MDVSFFLKQRTAFIRSFHDAAAAPFEDIQRRIENDEPPFDNPPYSEDGEPAYVTEWIEAGTARDIVAQSCVALLADSLKLYFHSLRTRVIGFTFDDAERSLLKKGLVPAFKAVLGEVYDTDWSDCPVDFRVIEQILLARNRSQHGADITSFHISHDARTLREHPRPLFVDPGEWEAWAEAVGDDRTFFTPAVKITRDTLLHAADEVDALADWLEARADRVPAWRRRRREADQAQPNG